MSYSDLLRDPRWQRKRLEVMERAGFACEICGDDRTTLNVHHVRYVRGRMPWEYEHRELRCLCEPCHQRQHPEKAHGLTPIAAILPNALAAAASRSWTVPEARRSWDDILRRFGVVDRYDPEICIICHAAFRVDLTRCADCRAENVA